MRSSSAGLVVAVAFAAACGGKTGRPADAGADGNRDLGPIASDAPMDTASDAGSTADAPVVDGGTDAPVLDAGTDAPSPGVSFVFTNSTGHTIYIQTSGFSTQGYWSLAEGGARLPVDNTCEVCDCSQCQTCPVCGRALARVEALAPGGPHRWTWDGRIWVPVPDGCGANIACDQDQVVPAGAALAVTVTYAASFTVDTSSGADDQFIGTPALTATVAFTNAPGASVEITATQ